MLFIFIIIYIIVFAVYFVSPLPVRLLILLINFFVPDPIPVIDEVIMIAGIISKLTLFGRIVEFAQNHKRLVKVLTALVVIGIILLIVSIFR